MSEVKRYLALTLRTEGMGFINEHPTNKYGAYDVVLTSDHDRKVAELEAENAELQKTPNELRRVLAEVRTENAELRKETESCADVNADLLDDLTRAVELLWDAWGNIDSNYEELLSEIHAFLTKMENV